MKKHGKIMITVVIILVVIVIITIVFMKNIKQKDKENVGEIITEERYKDIEEISTYNNPIIPEGFKKVETETASWEIEKGIPKGWNNGLVIEDEIGNQFVWVPVESIPNVIGGNIEEDYIFYRGLSCNEKELIQILKYGGFYVGRYEAGLPQEIIENTTEFSKNTNNVEGIPTSKKGQIVWNFIDWNMAKINAQKMYNKNNISSDLITYNQWNKIMYWLDNSGYDIKDSRDYGNYSNVNFVFDGKYSIDYGKTYEYNNEKSKVIYNMILSAGATERNKTNNIYDLAGNVTEFQDYRRYINGDYGIEEDYRSRGGYYDNVGTGYSISSDMSISEANSRQGFRIVLYQQ